MKILSKITILLFLCCMVNVKAQTKIITEGLKPSVYTTSNGVTHYIGTRKMEIEGFYQAKNLFIMNTFGHGGVGYCVKGLKVNSNYTTDEINGSSFMIDLSVHKLKLNEKFKVEIMYTDSCAAPEMPLIMNPGAIKINDPMGNNSLIIEGTNYNASLLVTNPRSKDGKSYGIKSVTVNGKKVEAIAADVFEISFFKMEINYQEKLKIEFKYENSCDPVILNPEVISW